MTNLAIQEITAKIEERSKASRALYLNRIETMKDGGRNKPSLSCGNLAHAFAACPDSEKTMLLDGKVADIAIVSSYNDMLSAHQPYHLMLDQTKEAILKAGGVAQMAGGVPAMCDGVTQGQSGMEMSLFSRDVIALSTAVAMSHNVFDAGLLFGICDKIVPGLLIGALSFGHLPFAFVPAGPMPTGISNSEKQAVRQKFATGEADEKELLMSEARAYHSPGTCTFYGTANSNQMMLEMMGLQLPGSSFVQPTKALRRALSDEVARLMVEKAHDQNALGLGEIVDARSIVNGIIALLSTGGSTNHTLHIVAIAAAAGYKVTWQDFSDISANVPLLSRVYPNGTADVNGFHDAGGVPYVMKQLLDGGFMNSEALTITGETIGNSCFEPVLNEKKELAFSPAPKTPGDVTIVRPHADPFQENGGLAVLKGNIGECVIKVSAVKEEHQVIEAPAVVFHDQDEMIAAYKAGDLEKDFVAVVRFQGPKANGMPELHKLTPSLGVLQDKGFKIALITDGRMSGASGKVPAAIHISPEALLGGQIGRIENGDIIRLDAKNGTLEVMADLESRPQATPPSFSDTYGRDLFAPFRNLVGAAGYGGSIFNPNGIE
ncbi:phosphogluconate dehydratase [Temperatibacter marinus]|uniref:Phosphogluconate dehydratase n=1 Tax=Temperatibacter marinus TaxID=1456591 RepID=A0AA52EEC7_9PROT|nr:phosphogluconate dehydratase [Temperatibacter marinus]WND03165.1 phosphogluconate dehydratase [Temperatibacter marinus]